MRLKALSFVAIVSMVALGYAVITYGQQNPTTSPAVYNPYPPGILPSNINAELARVSAEVDFIEARAFARWKAMKPPVLTNQPPILANTGTQAIEVLGELMNYDRKISLKQDIACSSCHMPYVAFSGPIPSVNLTMVAYPGTEHFRAGKRTAQRYTYAPFFPVLPTKNRVFSLAETSGIHARPDTC